MSAADSQQELIARAVAGDGHALERLLLEHSARLKWHIGRRLPSALQDSVDAEDILQQTFIQAFRGITNYQAGPGSSFGAWLKSIAEMRLRDAVKTSQRTKRGGGRRRVRKPALGDADSIASLIELLPVQRSTPSQSAVRRESVRAVRVAIAALPENQRTAIRLHLLEGKSLEETAVAMNRSPDAVRGLVHRAKHNLGEALGRSSLWLSRKG